MDIAMKISFLLGAATMVAAGLLGAVSMVAAGLAACPPATATDVAGSRDRPMVGRHVGSEITATGRVELVKR